MKLACLKLKCLCDDVMPRYYRTCKMSRLPRLHGGLGGGREEERNAGVSDKRSFESAQDCKMI